MLENVEHNLAELRNTLIQLQAQVYSNKTLSSKDKNSLNLIIKAQLADVNPNENNLKNCVKKIQNKLGLVEGAVAKKISYVGDVDLEDFMATGNLFEVTNAVQQGSVYFYFSPDFIDNFYKLNEKVQGKFCRLVQGGDVKFAAAQNDQGIKYLGNKENLPKCSLQINQEYQQCQIHYELKVMGTEDRIGIVAVKPKADGPEILIATHAIKGGFHSNKHNSKALKSSAFVVPSKNLEQADKMAKFGMFAVDGANKVKEEAEKSVRNNAGIKVH